MVSDWIKMTKKISPLQSYAVFLNQEKSSMKAHCKIAEIWLKCWKILDSTSFNWNVHKTQILFIKSRNIIWKIFDVIGFNSIYHLQSYVNEPRVLFALHTRKIGTQTYYYWKPQNPWTRTNYPISAYIFNEIAVTFASIYNVLQASPWWLFLPIYFHMAVTVHMICEIVTFSISISIYFICD